MDIPAAALLPRLRNHSASSVAVTTLVFALLSGTINGQTPAVTTNPEIRERASYEALLRNLARLQNKADDLKRTGLVNSGIQQAVCTQLNLKVADCVVTLATAKATGVQLEQLDLRAKTLILEVRRQHKSRAAGAVLPPPPPELAQLQAEREALVTGTISSLRSHLSPEGLTAFRAVANRPATALTPGNPAGGKEVPR